MKITTLIVDDEPLARERLRRMLARETDIEIVGECVGGREAVKIIESERPRLVFLDVQMPEMSGFEVLQIISPELMPAAIVFVTAYDRYAIQAFEFHALDYLLKPFDEERLRAALERARAEIKKRRFAAAGGETFDERIGALLGSLKTNNKYAERFVLKSIGRIYFIRTEEVDWIEAAGNYVNLHVGRENHLLRETMNNIENRLDPDRFLRIHRSAIVNIDFIKELSPLFNGDYKVVLNDDTELTLSRKYHDRLLRLFDKSS
jgi:two-component system, LytTR family, response regulator